MIISEVLPYVRKGGFDIYGCLLTWLLWCPGAPGWRAPGWWCWGGRWSPPCQCSESPGAWWASLSWSGVSIVHWGLWRHHAMHLEDCLTLILMQLATNYVQFYSQSSLIVVTVRGPPLAASDAPLTSERVTWSEDRRPLSRQIHISRLFLYTWPVYLLYTNRPWCVHSTNFKSGI